MNRHSDENLPSADFEFDTESAEEIHAPTSAGTFPLRRAQYFSQTGTPLLSAEQHQELTNLVNEVDPDTKHMMIVQNLRMVVSIARRYTNRGLDLVDLVRAGNHGLIQALEKYELDWGFRFSPHITRSICQNIEQAIMNQNITPGALHTSTVNVVSSENSIH